MPSRRSLIASVATATTALAGCADRDADPSTSTDTDDGSTAADGTDSRGTPTTAAPGVTVDTVEPTAVDGPVRVLPVGLRRLLVEAARGDEPARGEFDVRVSIPPAPALLDVGTVELRGTDGVDGTYAVDVEGGNSYRRQYVAEPASSVPEDATVVDAASLPADRREFVRAAVEEHDVRVEPQTELGSWARRTFDGGYVRFEGAVYAGREEEQTDAGLLTGTVWYVLSLAPTDDATDATVLDCSPVDADAVDALVDVVARDGRYPKTVDAPGAELRSFASATDYCTLHKLTLDVAVG